MRFSALSFSLATLLALSACEDEYVCTCAVTCDGVVRVANVVICADDNDIQEAVNECTRRVDNQCAEASCACACAETSNECVDS